MDARVVLDPEVDEKEDKMEPSTYIDNDPEDTIVKATERLYKPPKSGILSFFKEYFRCFAHSSIEDELSELEDSFSEPLPSHYNILKNGKK